MAQRKVFGEFLRRSVEQGALREEETAQLLMNAAQVESLKRVVAPFPALSCWTCLSQERSPW